MIFPPENAFLASISQRDLGLFKSHLRLSSLERGAKLAEVDHPMARVYFPESGVISIVVTLAGGQAVEAAMVGRDSVIGGKAALDRRLSLFDAVVQVAGDAYSIDFRAFREAAMASETLRAEIAKHEEFLFAQVLQSTACFASHVLTARLARWLMHARDLSQSDKLALTQEFVAEMLGVQRTSVTAATQELHDGGFIRTSRGSVEITNVEGLRNAACECYETIQARWRRLNDDQPTTPHANCPV